MSNLHGYKWITIKKRYAIYERDGFRCLWCRRKVEPKNDFKMRIATLDHFVPRDAGGSNRANNIFTACYYCNSKRQHQPAIAFAKSFEVVERIQAQLDKPLVGIKERFVNNGGKRKTQGQRGRARRSSADPILVAAVDASAASGA